MRAAALAAVSATAAILMLSGSSVAAAPTAVHTDALQMDALHMDALHMDYIRTGEYWLDQYGIRSAWSTTQGKGITIAVIDTGVDGSVSDLAGAVTGGIDYSGQGAANGEKPVGDATERDHGTMVASLAAGRGTSGAAGLKIGRAHV